MKPINITAANLLFKLFQRHTVQSYNHRVIPFEKVITILPSECLYVIKNMLFLGVLLNWLKGWLSSYLSDQTCLSRINMKKSNMHTFFFFFADRCTLSACRINDSHISIGLLLSLDWAALTGSRKHTVIAASHDVLWTGC